MDPSDLVRVVDRITERVGRWSEGGVLTDEQFCVFALAAARDVVFPEGLSSGEVRDDRDVADVLWGGWGRPETWPLVRDVETIHRLVQQRPGSVGFVARAWPGRIGHGYVVMHHAGKARWIDPQHSGVGGLRLLPSDTWPGGELLALGERGGAREFDLRALLYDVGNRAPIPIPDSALTAPPSRVADALVDLELYYRGTGNEDEQRDYVVLMRGSNGRLTEPADRKIVLARHVDGLFRLETEEVAFYSGPELRFYRSLGDATRAGGTGEPALFSVVERVSGVARGHVHEVTRPEPRLIYDAYAEMSSRTAEISRGRTYPIRNLFVGLGLVFPGADEAELARGAHDGPKGSRFHWSVGVVSSGLRGFLDYLLPRVWRTRAIGFPTQA
ncbi:toxin glutamine deamidase domain-containing protein, partial [Micromonospora arborensis]|uniref:toxin glutamine deamidase domain-containing protein n=1 Tax=Micromonospora arborensis TaxID=2116518 RepID=UPI0034458CBC